MKKTVYLSEKVESGVKGYSWRCPYIFYDRSFRKWREDTTLFNDVDEFVAKMKRQGYKIS